MTGVDSSARDRAIEDDTTPRERAIPIIAAEIEECFPSVAGFGRMYAKASLNALAEHPEVLRALAGVPAGVTEDRQALDAIAELCGARAGDHRDNVVMVVRSMLQDPAAHNARRVRALAVVDRLGGALQNLIEDSLDPGTEALGAVWEGRSFLSQGGGAAGLPAPDVAAEDERGRELEQLRAELERRHEEAADALVQQTTLKGLTVEEGAAVLQLGPPRELVIAWVDAARKMLGDAPNYSETRIDFPAVSMEVKAAGEVERYVFTVQRAGKLTPHEARQRAEAELERLRARVAELEGVERALARALGRDGRDREVKRLSAQRDAVLAVLDHDVHLIDAPALARVIRTALRVAQP